MRPISCWFLVLACAACGADQDPPPASLPAPGSPSTTSQLPPAAPADVTTVDPDAAAAARDLLGGAPTTSHARFAAEHVVATAAATITLAATGDLQLQARAPQTLRDLGLAALPALTERLGKGTVAERRLAALTLLQWSDDLQRDGHADPVVAALRAAQTDADGAVRAAAEHALRLATGDTTALDKSRAEHDAAVQKSQDH